DVEGTSEGSVVDDATNATTGLLARAEPEPNAAGGDVGGQPGLESTLPDLSEELPRATGESQTPKAAGESQTPKAASSSGKTPLTPPGAEATASVFPVYAEEWRMWGGNPSRNMVNPFARKIATDWDVDSGKN